MNDPRTVQELFSDKSRWTQGAYSRDWSGNIRSPTHRDACCWCLSGAIIYVYADNAYRAFKKIARVGLQEHELSTWNDVLGRTFEEVVDLCKKAGI